MEMIDIITNHNMRKYLLKTNYCDTIDTLVTKKFKYIDNIDLSLEEV